MFGYGSFLPSTVAGGNQSIVGTPVRLIVPITELVHILDGAAYLHNSLTYQFSSTHSVLVYDTPDEASHV